MSDHGETVRTDEDLDELPRVSTGNQALDTILCGGFDRNRLYLYEGKPGTGKTTIALEFLLEGVRQGERVLYITLSETERELRLEGGTAGHFGGSTYSNLSHPKRPSIRSANSRCFILPNWNSRKRPI